MKRGLGGVCLALALGGLGGCVIVADVSSDLSWGSWTEREREINEAIDRIDFSSRGTLYVVQSEETSLRIEGNENAISRVSITEGGDTLTITDRAAAGPWWQESNKATSEVVFYLEIPVIEEIRHRGHGEMKVGPLTLDRLNIETSGHADTQLASVNARAVDLEVREHGNVTMETLDSDRVRVRASTHADVFAHDVNALDVEVEIADHGEVWLAGRADMTKAEIRDHGDLDAARLQCEVVDVRAVDHGSARLWVEDTLGLRKNDHAHVEWKGAPEVSEKVSISSK